MINIFIKVIVHELLNMIQSRPFKKNPFATHLCGQIDETTVWFKSEIRRKNKPNLRVHNSAGQLHPSAIKSNGALCHSIE